MSFYLLSPPTTFWAGWVNALPDWAMVGGIPWFGRICKFSNSETEQNDD